MDKAFYDRAMQWGGILQGYRNISTVSDREYQLLAMRSQTDPAYTRILQALYLLAGVDEPMTTADIAEVLQVSKQTLTQLLQAARRGGFYFETVQKGHSKLYTRVNIPEKSVLRKLIEAQI
ncbi:hypothetical protein [Chroococcidiopsis sp.]|uniref:hypothetical protein n=1 Tax=Chroococcidiopsis sp. TaxID=3088168 RepID=UPI003F39F1CF